MADLTSEDFAAIPGVATGGGPQEEREQRTSLPEPSAAPREAVAAEYAWMDALDAAAVHRPIAPEIPPALLEYVGSICRSEVVVQQVIERAEKTVLRRIRSTSFHARHARWAKRWQPDEQDRTKRWLGRLRDEVLSVNHLGQVAQHVTFPSRPSSRDGESDHVGCLFVDDPESVSPSIGVPSYLEQTPVVVFAWAYENWWTAQLNAGNGVTFLGELRGPQVWDLTAGSGTGADYFAGIPGAQIIQSDINVGPSEGVAMLDCRHVGMLKQHRRHRRNAPVKPELVVHQPDIIFLDPPSGGRPTHAELYHGLYPSLDLALLPREPWLIAIAHTVTEAVRYLAPGGFLSLLLRCGRRMHGGVQEDAGALDDLKLILGDRVRIEREMPVVFGHRRNQVSLRQARVPAVHLRIERMG